MTNKEAHQIQHGQISSNESMAQIRPLIHSYQFCSGQSYMCLKKLGSHHAVISHCLSSLPVSVGCCTQIKNENSQVGSCKSEF